MTTLKKANTPMPSGASGIMRPSRYEGGGDLFADPAGAADRRAAPQPARCRAAVQLADQNWAALEAARASIASFTAPVRAAQIALVGIQEEALTGTCTVLDAPRLKIML